MLSRCTETAACPYADPYRTFADTGDESEKRFPAENALYVCAVEAACFQNPAQAIAGVTCRPDLFAEYQGC